MVFFDKIIRPTYYGYARRSCRSSEEQSVSENSLYSAVLFFSGSTVSRWWEVSRCRCVRAGFGMLFGFLDYSGERAGRG